MVRTASATLLFELDFGGISNSSPVTGFQHRILILNPGSFNGDFLLRTGGLSEVFDETDSERLLTFLPGVAEFDDFAEALTDGVNGQFTRGTSLEKGPGFFGSSGLFSTINESGIYGGLPVSLNNIYFEGYNITRLEVLLGEVSVLGEGLEVGDSTFRIFGDLQTTEVPEPSSLILLGLSGGLALFARRRGFGSVVD